MDTFPVSYRGIVYPWHLDHMGHMNVQHYVGMFDQGTWGFMALVGFTQDHFRAQGIGAAALEQHIRYQRELVAGDAVEVRTGVLEFRDKVFRLVHEMSKSATGELAARVEIVAVFMDTVARKSVTLPPAFRERAAVYLVPSPAAAANAGREA